MSFACLHRILFAGALLLGVSARSDTVTLRDGSVREGQIIRQSNEELTLEVRFGALKGTLVIPAHEIVSIKRQMLPADPVESAAAKLRSEAESKTGGAAADAWVRLGDLYAKNPGFSSQAKEAYEQAIRLDPEYTAAHHRLGHVKTKQGWRSIDDERRREGLVPLDDMWVKPAERSQIIDQRHEQQNEELRIGPRLNEPLTREDVERFLKIKQAEEELANRDRLRLAYGESLLSRYGYYLPGGHDLYIGSGQTPYPVEGVGLQYGNSDFFAGTVGSGYSPSYNSPYFARAAGPYSAGYTAEGRSKAISSFRRNFGFSPGLVWGNAAFGTNFGSHPYSGYYGYGSGYGFSFSGGSKNFKYNVHLGGFSSQSTHNSSTGIGFGGF